MNHMFDQKGIVPYGGKFSYGANLRIFRMRDLYVKKKLRNLKILRMNLDLTYNMW